MKFGSKGGCDSYNHVIDFRNNDFALLVLHQKGYISKAGLGQFQF